jgi:hypothetical protein
VTWLTNDAVSGVRHVLAESQRNSTAWSPVPPAPNTGSTASVTLDRTSSWRLRVTPTDVAGNTGASATIGPVTTTVVEDGSTRITYSGRWTRATSSDASGGSIRYATASGATATLSFTGRAVAWVAPVGSKLGKAKVFIDGALVTTIDLKSTTGQARRILFSTGWGASGAHSIKIKVLGTSGRPRVNLDGFIILT